MKCAKCCAVAKKQSDKHLDGCINLTAYEHQRNIQQFSPLHYFVVIPADRWEPAQFLLPSERWDQIHRSITFPNNKHIKWPLLWCFWIWSHSPELTCTFINIVGFALVKSYVSVGDALFCACSVIVATQYSFQIMTNQRHCYVCTMTLQLSGRPPYEKAFLINISAKLQNIHSEHVCNTFTDNIFGQTKQQYISRRQNWQQDPDLERVFVMTSKRSTFKSELKPFLFIRLMTCMSVFLTACACLYMLIVGEHSRFFIF